MKARQAGTNGAIGSPGITSAKPVIREGTAIDSHTPTSPCRCALELGVRPKLAGNTAGSGRGPRYLAQAKALSVGLSNAYFQSLGLPTLSEES